MAAAAPLALSSSAEAALKMPTKVPPERVRPLGTWAILDARPTVEVGSVDVVAEVLLTFRSEIDVAVPYLNVWPRSIPLASLPPPVPPVPGVPRTPIPVGSPHRPAEQVFGTEVAPGDIEPTELLSGVLVPVLLQIPVRRNTCSSSYRVTVQMSDGPTATRAPGPTRRRALFSFMLKVVGTNCYTSTVPDPLLPTNGRTVNARPTSRPAATKTPRLPPFRTATPTPV
jgi:hypothetical protein